MSAVVSQHRRSKSFILPSSDEIWEDYALPFCIIEMEHRRVGPSRRCGSLERARVALGGLGEYLPEELTQN